MTELQAIAIPWNATCCPASTKTLEVLRGDWKESLKIAALGSTTTQYFVCRCFGCSTRMSSTRRHAPFPAAARGSPVPAGTQQPSVGGRCSILRCGLGRTGRRLSAASIQPRALCPRVDGIADYRLQITGRRE